MTDVTWDDVEDTSRIYDQSFYSNKWAHIGYLSGNLEECRRIALDGYALVENIPLDALEIEQGCYNNIAMIFREDVVC